MFLHSTKYQVLLWIKYKSQVSPWRLLDLKFYLTTKYQVLPWIKYKSQVLPWRLLDHPWPIQPRMKISTPLYTERFPTKKVMCFPPKPNCKLNPDWLKALVFPQRLERQHPVNNKYTNTSIGQICIHFK